MKPKPAMRAAWTPKPPLVAARAGAPNRAPWRDLASSPANGYAPAWRGTCGGACTCSIYNCCGPTEATTFALVAADVEDDPLIGRHMAGAHRRAGYVARGWQAASSVFGFVSRRLTA